MECHNFEKLWTECACDRPSVCVCVCIAFYCKRAASLQDKVNRNFSRISRTLYWNDSLDRYPTHVAAFDCMRYCYIIARCFLPCMPKIIKREPTKCKKIKRQVYKLYDACSRSFTLTHSIGLLYSFPSVCLFLVRSVFRPRHTLPLKKQFSASLTCVVVFCLLVVLEYF